MEKMHGIIAVTVTPFLENGDIDYAAAAKQIDWLIASGIHGILPIGATGEFSALSMDERKAYAEFCMKQVAGRIPVMIGAVAMNVEETLEVARHAASIKANSIMVLPSPGLHLSQDEIYEFYRHVSANVTLPVMVYNNPGSAGVDIDPDVMEKIAKLPNMEYLKESTGDATRLTLMTDTVADDLVIFCGCESLAFESFVMGAKGWISVAANFAPAMCVELFDLIVNKGDLQAARVIYRKLLPMLHLLEGTGQLWQIAKYAQAQQGIGNGALRKPRGPITPENKAAVDKLMAANAYK